MNDDNRQPDNDNPAVDGLLQEYAATEGKPDKKLIRDIMDGVATTEQEPPATPDRRSVLVFRLAAAAAGIAIILGIGWLLSRPDPIAAIGEEDLQVERRGKVRSLRGGASLYPDDVVIGAAGEIIIFTDGSTAKLDRQARLRLREANDDERVALELESGRVLFRAGPAAGRFKVDAGVPVEVVGTVFGVHRLTDRATVHVYRGQVLVGGVTGVHVNRGESALAVDGESPLMSAADPNQALAWAREPRWFAQTPLQQVAAWLEQNSSYRFVIAPGLETRRVSARFGPGSDMKKEIETLMMGHDFEWSMDGDTVHITGRN